MVYTILEHQRMLNGKSTIELVNILQCQLKMKGSNISLHTEEAVRQAILSALMVFKEGPNVQTLIIRKLPPEILVAIFDHVRLQPCMRGTRNTSAWDPVTVRMDSLVLLSHVCRYWRQLVVDTPTLWTNIDNPKRYLSFSLQRARTASVSIAIENEPDYTTQAYLEAPVRLRELRWYDIDVYMARKHLNRSALSLEDLSLADFTSPASRGLRLQLRPQGRGRELQLFQGQTPVLRRLTLDSLDWTPSLQTAMLTHLYLADLCGPNLLPRMLTLLSASPGLTDLVLADRNDLLSQVPDIQHPAVIPLRYLKRLVLKTMSSAGASRMLSYMELSPQTCVRLVTVRPIQSALLAQLSRLPLAASLTRMLIRGVGSRRGIIAEGPTGVGIHFDHFVAENEEWGSALQNLQTREAVNYGVTVPIEHAIGDI